MAIWQTNEKGALPPPTDLECGVYIDKKKKKKIISMCYALGRL